MKSERIRVGGSERQKNGGKRLARVSSWDAASSGGRDAIEVRGF